MDVVQSTSTSFSPHLRVLEHGYLQVANALQKLGLARGRISQAESVVGSQRQFERAVEYAAGLCSSSLASASKGIAVQWFKLQRSAIFASWRGRRSVYYMLENKLNDL